MSVNYKNGKHAVTHYKVIERFKNYTYIKCQLETGRTHQIRVHMAHIRHPLLGDAVYVLSNYRDRHYMQKHWVLFIHVRMSILRWMLHFRIILSLC